MRGKRDHHSLYPSRLPMLQIMEIGRRVYPGIRGNMFCGAHDIQPNSRSSIQRTTNFIGAAPNKQNLRDLRNAGIHSPIRSIHGGEITSLKKPKGLKARHLSRGYAFMYVSKSSRGCRRKRLVTNQRLDVISRPFIGDQLVLIC